MPLTDQQLKILANHYMFDVTEARKLLGLDEPSKRGRPPKVPKFPDTPGSKIPQILHPTDLTKTNTTSRSKATKQKRRPSGYHLFMSHYKDRIRDELEKRGESRSSVVSIIALKWKELPEEKKKGWLDKANA